MNNKQATRPDYFNDFRKLRSLKTDEEAKERGIDPEDNELAFMSETRGWQILKEYIQAEIKELSNITQKQMEDGKPFEEIGRNAVVSQLTKDLLNRILLKVSDAKEAIERNPAKPKKGRKART